MSITDIAIVGSACAYLAVFATLVRNAWNATYYDDEGNPNGL